MLALLIGSRSGLGVQQNGADPYTQAVDGIRALHQKGDYDEAVARSRALLVRIEQDSTAVPAALGSVLDALVESLVNAESRDLTSSARDRATASS